MKKYLNFLTILFVSIVSIFMITGCEKENSPAQVENNQQTEQDLQQKIEDRITELVEGATDDKILQAEMREELRYLIDHDIVRWDDVTIVYSPSQNDFVYKHSGDLAIPRDWLQDDIKYNLENPSLSTRSHRRYTYFVTPSTYNVYIHTDVDPDWATAVSQAISAWNGLGLTVSFTYAGSTSYKNNPGSITVIEENIGNPYADAYSPNSSGYPGYQVRIHTSNPTTNASQKKFIMAHEFGHTIGFLHTNTSEGTILTSYSYPCISSSCNGPDGVSVLRPGQTPVPSWIGFSTCDANIFQCIY